jgi:hypothetical protein
MGLAWARLLQQRRTNTAFTLLSVSIVSVSQFSKYVPGNIAQHVGRVAMSKIHGITYSKTIFSMYLEIALLVLAAAGLAIVGTAFSQPVDPNASSRIPGHMALLALVLGMLIAPFVGHGLFQTVAAWIARKKGVPRDTIEAPSPPTLLHAVFLYVISFLVLGAALYITAAGVFGEGSANFLLLAGIFSVSWLVGFLTPGAPAGLGVREVMLVALLTPIYGEQLALGIAAILRVITVLGDGIAFAVGLLLLKLPTVREAGKGCTNAQLPGTG